MARNRPVAIWVIRQRPSRDPKFHQAEMFDGAGRSITALFMILIRGWVVRSVAIKRSVGKKS
jgi:flagellar biogenesis protein FliO